MNLQNAVGATPLMLASLYGHLRIVKALIARKASLDIRDKRGRVAADYARRGRYAKSQFRLYRKRFPRHATGAEFRRNKEQIFELLTNPSALQAISGEQKFGQPVFYKSGKTLILLKPLAKIHYGRQFGNSAVASIASGKGLKPEMFAVSGWSSPGTNTPGVLDNERYTQLVREAIGILGSRVRRHRDDKGDHGIWHACHSEKKLAVYWVLEQIRYVFGSDDLARMKELKNINLPDGRKEATVYVDHEPCRDCTLFTAAIYRVTGLEINLFGRPFVQKGTRNNKDSLNGYCPHCLCEACEKKQEQEAEELPPQPRQGHQGQTPPPAPDTRASSLQEEEIDSSMPPESPEWRRNQANQVQYIGAPRVRLSTNEWKWVDGYGKPPDVYLEEDQEISHAFHPALSQQPQQWFGQQQDQAPSQRELSSLPDPRSYQEGQSAYFNNEIEVVLPRRDREILQLYDRATSRLSSSSRPSSRRGTPSVASGSVYMPGLRRSRPPRPKMDLRDAISSLKLRDRYAFVEQQPLQRKLVPKLKSLLPPPPPHTNSPSRRRQPLRKEGAAAVTGSRRRQTKRRTTTRRPREDALAGKSTLLGNLRYRQQQQQQQQGRRPLPSVPAYYGEDDDDIRMV